MTIQKVTNHEEFLCCTDVLLALRPHLQEKDTYTLFKEMQKQSYQLWYMKQDNCAVAFIGFRLITFFFSGSTVYIDDLSTLPKHRGNGYASALLQAVIAWAREQGAEAVTLDSGYTRHDAHRLYLNNGFLLASHHFHLQLQNQ